MLNAKMNAVNADLTVEYIESYEAAIKELSNNDTKLLSLLAKEHQRQNESLLMIAASSVASPEVLAASASDIMNVTLEGYVGNRFHAGTIVADEIELLAISRAKQIFGAEYVNVQPLSGTLANLSILFGFMSYKDKILSLALNSGGHLTHGASVSITGKYFDVIHYDLDAEGYINYEKVNLLAKEHQPKIIIAGASAYTRLIDYERFRKIADQTNSLLLADISHISGLIAAGVIPSPINYAHFTTTSTYKQLYGPRGGIICMGKDAARPYRGKKLSDYVNKAVFPGCQGTPDLSMIAAKAAAFKKVDTPSFKMQMQKVIQYADRIAELFKEKGYRLEAGGTDNHMILINILYSKQLSGLVAEKALEQCNIIINKNMLQNDKKPPSVCSGIRLGTNILASLDRINYDSLSQIVDLIDEILGHVVSINDREFRLDENFVIKVKKKVKSILLYE
jgi:glycine hydroxymethyltransferase